MDLTATTSWSLQVVRATITNVPGTRPVTTSATVTWNSQRRQTVTLNTASMRTDTATTTTSRDFSTGLYRKHCIMLHVYRVNRKRGHFFDCCHLGMKFQRRLGRCQMPIMTIGRFGLSCGPFWLYDGPFWIIFLGYKIFGAVLVGGVLAMGRFGIAPISNI